MYLYTLSVKKSVKFFNLKFLTNINKNHKHNFLSYTKKNNY